MANINGPEKLTSVPEATPGVQPDVLEAINERNRAMFLEAYGRITLREIAGGMPVQVREERK